ncbi:integrase, catalytic region, zinc finger, CCHC-type containing protein [Tanacetum coccineum]|uniref:Integrase, catalytic region, zinc finger, CCHC-type containing protein n=1 Tax=Tanacetum coccineum TaxID=301880 RepID=A0ABQ4XIV4_9ASTR
MGSLPLCTKYNYHHKGPCASRCNKCKKIDHLARDCRSSGPNSNVINNNVGTSDNSDASLVFECGVQGHFKKDCPKLKNGNRGNPRGNGNALAKVYVVGNAGTNPDSNVVPGSENRPPMLERGSYIPWASRFRRYLNWKRDPRKWLPKRSDIYNSVDACTSAKDMWKRVERLMRGTIQNKVDRETRFTNEFDQFVAEPGEVLVSVYNRFAQLMNDLERNNMNFPTVTINTKYLNSLQPEWLKYVTQVRLAKRLTVDSFDDLFDYLQQFEKLVNTSREKKLEKSHDHLALVAHTGSSSRQTSSYYVSHLSFCGDL